MATADLLEEPMTESFAPETKQASELTKPEQQELDTLLHRYKDLLIFTSMHLDPQAAPRPLLLERLRTLRTAQDHMMRPDSEEMN